MEIKYNISTIGYAFDNKKELFISKLFKTGYCALELDSIIVTYI